MTLHFPPPARDITIGTRCCYS